MYNVHRSSDDPNCYIIFQLICIFTFYSWYTGSYAGIYSEIQTVTLGAHCKNKNSSSSKALWVILIHLRAMVQAPPFRAVIYI